MAGDRGFADRRRSQSHLLPRVAPKLARKPPNRYLAIPAHFSPRQHPLTGSQRHVALAQIVVTCARTGLRGNGLVQPCVRSRSYFDGHFGVTTRPQFLSKWSQKVAKLEDATESVRKATESIIPTKCFCGSPFRLSRSYSTSTEYRAGCGTTMRVSLDNQARMYDIHCDEVLYK